MFEAITYSYHLCRSIVCPIDSFLNFDKEKNIDTLAKVYLIFLCYRLFPQFLLICQMIFHHPNDYED